MSRPTRRTVLGLAAAAVAGAAGLRPGVAAASNPGRAHGWATATLARMTLEEKVGQLFVTYAYGATAQTADRRNVTAYGVATPAEVVAKYKLGGVIYFAWTDSVANPPQIAALSNGLQQASLAVGDKVSVPLLISTDQEHGVVFRVGPPATQFPGAMALGAGRSTADAREAAAIAGAELRAVGVNQAYAPVADVNVNALNPVIGVRSFSSDPTLVADLTAAQVTGLEGGGGIASCAKHFPGHGDTVDDSHTSLPTINHTREQWNTIDAPPFEAAIEAGIDSIMTAHIVVPSLDPSGEPATLSKPILTGILREQLGYDGVVITDSLAMAGVRQKYGDAEVAVRALEAGCDQLLMSPAMDVAYNAVLAAVRSGRITEKRLDQSVYRVLRLKHLNGVVADPMVDVAAVPSVVGTPEHYAAAQRIADRTTTVVKNEAGLLPLSAGPRKVLVTGYGVSTTQTLANRLTARGATTTVRQTGATPSDTAIAGAVAAARANDLTVVLTMKAWDTAVTDKQGKQQKLVKDLLATGKPVIVVAVRDPYDIAYFTAAPTYLATYSYADVSMESLAKVLYGELKPAGKLPVDVPVAGSPATKLYPFGHGLTW
ncbi:glycoside hydrolase family 3 domain protein [Kribbella flavida DSM 17836]|uniref:beta-N-acetylhexosaminidase n=1 Tax=Kribbella flavida (strain DSM 17836 / JCM 10339 / NBRC 14399) TaxID=479435 RepID=D2PT32_KRIFD|nr:glycoside hydrolase family 3 protein [Kribbella flavida]ADB35084.1 glycoside hydrolase family 3 domain protein [Kribbella flavida DSM 17836]